MSGTGLDIAIIGMAGRFPGAHSVDELWRNLCEGRESIARLDDEQLLRAGVNPATFGRPEYVRAHGALADFDMFDADFFGFAPQEAAALDPQHRVFLECAWEAFESAAIDPSALSERVGVYAGSSLNGYLAQVLPHAGRVESAEDMALLLALDKDFLATRVSYKLNLRGPSLAVQTACSTSLVAVHLACQALWLGECELALAGGVSISVPHNVGYLYREGGIASPDGHCRAFDARARGTVAASGAGVVLLRRLDDAVAAGDPIVAVIKGSAINNDGRDKIGFTAPSVAGQARAIREAQLAAGVAAETIGYVEAHGTGTPLGDPIEVAALTQAFRESTRATQFCALGSLKTNLGHLDAAAGVAGLIKAALALRHARIPKSLHFEAPNPEIDFAKSPFFVARELAAFPELGAPRRAAVSSFGIGGTNAHVVLEQAPARPATEAARGPHLLKLSARSQASLAAARARLADALERDHTLALADVAYTLEHGRRSFRERWAVAVETREQAIANLRAPVSESALAIALPDAMRSAGGRRVALPSTPFERARYWIDAPPPVARAERAATASEGLLYTKAWQRAGAIAHEVKRPEERLVVLTDDAALAAAFAQHDATCVEVRPGERFVRLGECSFALPVGDRDAYLALLDALGEAPLALVHALALAPTAADGFDEAQARGAESFLSLASACARRPAVKRLLALATGLHDITGDEELAPLHATLIGAVRSAARELGGRVVRLLDVGVRPRSPADYLELAARASSEAARGPERDVVVAHRGRFRLQLQLTRERAPSSLALREGGVVLITGGLGGLGLALGRFLHEQAGARLALLGRSAANAAQQLALDELSRAGAKCAVFEADVAEPRALEGALAAVRAQFGAIHGVVHAAASAQGGTLETLDAALFRRELAAKVKGALLLDALLDAETLDFVAYCSSLTALSGGFAQAAYAAANSFLDAYAEARSRAGLPVVAVALERVRGVGMAARSAQQLERLGLGELARDGMELDQAVRAFAQALALRGRPYVAVSHKPLVGLPEDEIALALAQRAATKAPVREFAGLAEVEREIAAIWARAFGVAEVETTADFYALGGESLLALEILDRVRETFAVELPIARFFEQPTVAALARAVHAERARDAANEPAPSEPAIVALPRRGRKLERSGGEP